MFSVCVLSLIHKIEKSIISLPMQSDDHDHCQFLSWRLSPKVSLSLLQQQTHPLSSQNTCGIMNHPVLFMMLRRIGLLLVLGVLIAPSSIVMVDSFGIHHHPYNDKNNYNKIQVSTTNSKINNYLLSPLREYERSITTRIAAIEDDDDINAVNDYVKNEYDNDDDDLDNYNFEFLNKLMMPQLKQQLRLRGMKVSGKKQELISRLMNNSNYVKDKNVNNSINSNSKSMDENKEEPFSATSPTDTQGKEKTANEQQHEQKTQSKAQKFANEQGKDFIDVEAYLDEDDKGKDVKTSLPSEEQKRKSNDDNAPLSNPEVWGSEAKVVDDYEGRSPVVDGLSRTIIEYRGSNQTDVKAFVVASWDAMKPFLAGGGGGIHKNRTITSNTMNSSTTTIHTDAMRRLREIQTKRESSEKRPVRIDDEQGLDEGDETGIYKDALHRDFSDWGEYTVTGAQLSAEEVQGVLILSDVYGPFSEATKSLAEKIAFECQPVVCMVPDLFRDNPWREDRTTPGFNDRGQEYEEWRKENCDETRVSVDIRAAAMILREQYGVSSIVVWGTCFGGGRALEIAAGYLPENGKIHDVNGMIGPLPVQPDVVVAWYPTRYNAKLLFGPDRSSALRICEPSNDSRKFAIMGVFAGKDTLQGATPDDAERLNSFLENDDRIKDHMIKIFPDQDHGFAHNALGKDHDESELDRFVDDEFGAGSGRVTINDGDADVACLLSTAFMETYSRKFLPTAGSPVSKDESETQWNKNLNMQDLSSSTGRDVRHEIDESFDNHKDLPLEGKYIDPGNESQQDELFEALRNMQDPDLSSELQISTDDNLETAYAKLIAGDEDFQIF